RSASPATASGRSSAPATAPHTVRSGTTPAASAASGGSRSARVASTSPAPPTPPDLAWRRRPAGELAGRRRPLQDGEEAAGAVGAGAHGALDQLGPHRIGEDVG